MIRRLLQRLRGSQFQPMPPMRPIKRDPSVKPDWSDASKNPWRVDGSAHCDAAVARLRRAMDELDITDPLPVRSDDGPVV